MELGIVETALDFDVLQTVHLLGNETLSFDVTFVLHLDFCSFRYLFLSVSWCFQCSLQVRNNLRKIREIQMRTSDEVDELAAGAKWSSAERLQFWIYLILLDRIVGAEFDDSSDGFFFLYPPVVTVALGNSEFVCFSVSRASASSWRSRMRYSALEVNIRYGSSTPFVVRSSMSTPI